MSGLISWSDLRRDAHPATSRSHPSSQGYWCARCHRQHACARPRIHAYAKCFCGLLLTLPESAQTPNHQRWCATLSALPLSMKRADCNPADAGNKSPSQWATQPSVHEPWQWALRLAEHDHPRFLLLEFHTQHHSYLAVMRSFSRKPQDHQVLATCSWERVQYWCDQYRRCTRPYAAKESQRLHWS